MRLGTASHLARTAKRSVPEMKHPPPAAMFWGFRTKRVRDGPRLINARAVDIKAARFAYGLKAGDAGVALVTLEQPGPVVLPVQFSAIRGYRTVRGVVERAIVVPPPLETFRKLRIAGGCQVGQPQGVKSAGWHMGGANRSAGIARCRPAKMEAVVDD